jgi:predicted nucleic acid-binding protein
MSFTSAEFCDTNVLLYAHDEASPTKRGVAHELIARIGYDGTGTASIQVLQELFVSLTRKLQPAVPHAEARQVIAGVAESWHIYEPTSTDILSAIDSSASWQVSFWDAMLLTAANQVGATTLWTEDLNHGQTYGAVTVRNPFR